ncbi:MAG: hypothetical protein ACRCXZ_07610 [Patescibacteria group bacterium]
MIWNRKKKEPNPPQIVGPTTNTNQTVYPHSSPPTRPQEGNSGFFHNLGNLGGVEDDEYGYHDQGHVGQQQLPQNVIANNQQFDYQNHGQVPPQFQQQPQYTQQNLPIHSHQSVGQGGVAYSNMNPAKQALHRIKDVANGHQLAYQDQSVYGIVQSQPQYIAEVNTDDQPIDVDLINEIAVDLVNMVHIHFYLRVWRHQLHKTPKENFEIRFEYGINYHHRPRTKEVIDNVISLIVSNKRNNEIFSIKAVPMFGNVYRFIVTCKINLDERIDQIRKNIPNPINSGIKERDLNQSYVFVQDGVKTKIRLIIDEYDKFINDQELNHGPGYGALVGKRFEDFIIPFNQIKVDELWEAIEISNLRDVLILERYLPVSPQNPVYIHDIATVETGQVVSFTIVKSKTTGKN